ncbi:MAG: CoA-binding protein [Chloroflexota bacterium]|nr:MAG: CoA-binding protein [Chloroflexota bacterium]
MLEEFFSPRSVAVVGASRDTTKLSHGLLRNIVQFGFSGPIYPVNPRIDEVLGLKCYPSVTAIPGPVDLAVVVVPPTAVPSAIKDCGEKGVPGAVIITAGFRETGPAGAEAEHRVLEIARKYGMRLIGPNCVGVVDGHTHLNATFLAEAPLAGEISFMSQSGALGVALLGWARSEQIGFAKFVSLGNKADVTEVDLLNAWMSDRATQVVIAYLEGIADGRAFMEAASQLTLEKPLIILKSGTTDAGSRAVSSHTGTLSGSDRAYDAAFKQSGVIRARSVGDLFNFSVALAYQPPPRGVRLAIVTNAGGPGIMAADACERIGLQLASLSRSTIDYLKQYLPPTANFYNPIDVIGDAGPDRFHHAICAALKDEGVDGLLVILTPQIMTDVVETARVISAAAFGSSKPVLANFMGGDILQPGIKALTEAHIPNYRVPEEAIAAFQIMHTYHQIKERKIETPVHFDVDSASVSRLFETAQREGRRTLGDMDARGILSAYDMPVPRSILAHNVHQAVAAAEQIGYPVVMKVVSPDILHKSDVGGVRVGVPDADQVAFAFDDIIRRAHHYLPQAEISGVLVQEMISGGREVIIGLSRDATFGPMILFGLGGIYVEVLRDVSFRIAPVTPDQARAMIREIRSFPLLAGVRGEKPADVDAIVDAILRLSQLAMDFPEIGEMDINPLVVYERGKGAVAVDARMGLNWSVIADGQFDGE